MSRSSETLDLIVRVGVPEGRADSAALLARQLDAEELLLFVRDRELDVLLPARGFPQTVRGGPKWRAFFASCAIPGRHTGEVDLPEGRLRPALALASGRSVAVLLGGRPDEIGVGLLFRTLPLLGAALAAENDLALARLWSDQAAEEANRSRTLAVALDQARAAEARLNADLVVEHRRRDEFVAMLAHELRNPLAPLASTVDLLRLRPDEAGAHVELIGRQLDHFARLLDDLIDLSRVRTGKIELRQETVRIDALLAAALASAKPMLAERRHTVSLAAAREPLCVHGDRVRLTQVFFNLIHNAAKYTDPGGRIEVSAEREGDTAVVRVADNGIGIGPGLLERIFDLFTQSPAGLGRSEGGLGIGLTLVRSLVDLHGGNVEAQSAGEGQGSAFVVRLPLASGTVEMAPAPATRDAPRPAAGPLRVLVIDDNRDSADALASLLRVIGHAADVAHDAMKGLDAAAQGDFDLFIIDIGLPKISGYEVARRLRGIARPDAMLVAFSGYGSAEDRARSAAAGFHEHVVKPASIETFTSILERAAASRTRDE